MGQPARGEPLCRELADFFKQTEADSPRYRNALIRLSNNLLAQDKLDEAEPVLREVLVLREKQMPDAAGTFNTRSLLGGVLLSKKNFAEAEPLLVQGYLGLKQREASFDKHLLIEPLERLVRLYDAWGKPEEAARWRKKLEEAKSAAKPPSQL